MSATVMRFASEWGGLVEGLRRRIGAGGHADVQLGIGLNFNRLDDVTSVSKTYDSSRISWLMWQLGAEGGGGADAPLVDVAGLRRLLQQQLDFVSRGPQPGACAPSVPSARTRRCPLHACAQTRRRAPTLGPLLCAAVCCSAAGCRSASLRTLPTPALGWA